MLENHKGDNELPRGDVLTESLARLAIVFKWEANYMGPCCVELSIRFPQ